MFRNGVAEWNMALSGGIVLSGMTWSSLRRALSITDVRIIGERTFYRTQKGTCSEQLIVYIYNVETPSSNYFITAILKF